LWNSLGRPVIVGGLLFVVAIVAFKIGWLYVESFARDF
jgi:hypothetical protein